jgi:hypothetical protein
MERYDTRIPNNSDNNTSMHSYREIQENKYNMRQGHLPSNSACRCKIFKVDVFEILWQLALYAMIDRLETSNIYKINQTE